MTTEVLIIFFWWIGYSHQIRSVAHYGWHLSVYTNQEFGSIYVFSFPYSHQMRSILLKMAFKSYIGCIV